MWPSLVTFFTTNALKVWAALAVVLSVLSVLVWARNGGKNAEKVDQLIQTVNLIGKARENEQNNSSNLADGAAANKLQDDWSRR